MKEIEQEKNKYKTKYKKLRKDYNKLGALYAK